MEAGVKGAGANNCALQSAFDGTLNARAIPLKAFAGLSKGLARVMTQDRGGEGGDAILLSAQLCGQRGLLAEDKVVETLSLAMNQGGDTCFGAADGEVPEALSGVEELKSNGAGEPLILRGKMLGNFVLGLGDELGGG